MNPLRNVARRLGGGARRRRGGRRATETAGPQHPATARRAVCNSTSTRFRSTSPWSARCEHSLLWDLPSRARDAYRNAMDLDEQTWGRARAWAIAVGVSGVTSNRNSSPAFAAECRARLRAILTDAAAGRQRRRRPARSDAESTREPVRAPPARLPRRRRAADPVRCEGAALRHLAVRARRGGGRPPAARPHRPPRTAPGSQPSRPNSSGPPPGVRTPTPTWRPAPVTPPSPSSRGRTPTPTPTPPLPTSGGRGCTGRHPPCWSVGQDAPSSGSTTRSRTPTDTGSPTTTRGERCSTVSTRRRDSPVRTAR